MPFRDPRVLSDKLDNNITNAPAGVPSATSSPESDQIANDSSYTGGYVSHQRTNPVSPAPSVQETGEEGASVSYPTGTPNTNVSRGPGERDLAIDAGKSLLSKRGA